MKSDKEITFKQVLSSDGFLEYVELWQGENHIKVSFQALGSHKNGWRWSEVKDTIERLAKEASSIATERLKEGGYESL